MAETITTPSDGIILLGLGPGDPALLTREAWDWLEQIQTLYVRTKKHPAVASLPKHLKIESFDEVCEHGKDPESVQEEIIETILLRGSMPNGVTYAVPGHPFVAEATCPEIALRAKSAGIPIRVIDGISFLEPTFRALNVDPFPNLILTDAIRISMDQTPGFSPSMPALIVNIYSHAIAAGVKQTLMAVYPDDHPVRLVHAAGTNKESVEDLPLLEIDHSPHLGLLSSLYLPSLSPTASFEAFQEIIARLRAPDGCPWDREQTHLSLRPFLLEEAYEALDALDRGDTIDLQEELGDLLLQIVLHAQIAAEVGDFNIHHVLDGIGAKLIRRHPHVFSEMVVEDVSGVTRNWEAIKAEERIENGVVAEKGLLDGIPQALPALSQAEEIIERVSRVEFKLLEKMGDIDRIKAIIHSINPEDGSLSAEKLGQVLMMIASLAHQFSIDAESALREALSRFRVQFRAMETLAAESGGALIDFDDEAQIRLWEQAKVTIEKEDEA